MVDTLKLKGKIAENGYTLQQFAKALNISSYTLRKKMNNVNPTTTEEVQQMQNLLKFDNSTLCDIFFN